MSVQHAWWVAVAVWVAAAIIWGENISRSRQAAQLAPVAFAQVAQPTAVYRATLTFDDGSVEFCNVYSYGVLDPSPTQLQLRVARCYGDDIFKDGFQQ